MSEKYWRNVIDSLPLDANEVWAYDADEGVIAAIYDRFGWDHVYGDGDGLGDSKLYQVTHWMPRDKPDPPQGS